MALDLMMWGPHSHTIRAPTTVWLCFVVFVLDCQGIVCYLVAAALQSKRSLPLCCLARRGSRHKKGTARWQTRRWLFYFQICRVGQNHTYIHTHIRCIYGDFSSEIALHTVIYGVHVRFWPTLRICKTWDWMAHRTNVDCSVRCTCLVLIRHVCTLTHTHIYIHAQTLPRTYTHTHTRTHTYTHTWSHIHTRLAC